MSGMREQPSRAGGIGWFLAGYVGVAGFFVLEASTRQRGAASSLTASRDDRGTTRMIVAAYASAAVAAPLVRLMRKPQLAPAAAPLGLGVEAAGLVLRAWSMRTLGRSYSRTLRVEDAQHTVESGPYRFVRHPGYAGSLLIWTGLALTSRLSSRDHRSPALTYGLQFSISRTKCAVQPAVDTEQRLGEAANKYSGPHYSVALAK